MGESMDLQTIFEEHIENLCSFLDSMGIKSNINPFEFARDLKGGFITNAENWINNRIIIEGVDIDGIVYRLSQLNKNPWFNKIIQRPTNKWWSICTFTVEFHMDNNKKSWGDFRVFMNTKRKRTETVDYKWFGGKLADILNRDTYLKAPLLADLNAASDMGVDTTVAIVVVPPRPDKQILKLAKELIEALRKEGTQIELDNALKAVWPFEEGVCINRITAFSGQAETMASKLLPSEGAFRVYNRIARHIKEYVSYLVG